MTVQPQHRRFPFYPLLIGIFPVLSLLGNNISETSWNNAVRSFIVVLIWSFVLYTIILVIVKDRQKAALTTLLLLFLFYSYGHLNYILRGFSIGGIDFGRHRILVPIYAVFIGGALTLILRSKRDLTNLTKFLNVVGVFLIVLPLVQISIYLFQQNLAASSMQINGQNQGDILSAGESSPPDVYYLLTDGYPRADFISKHMDLDITPFIELLRARGFFLPACSQANYTDTRFSMAATLNMTYLDKESGVPEVLYSGSELDTLIRNGKVQQIFSELGYTIATFESGYKWLNWETSDLYFKPPPISSDSLLNIRLNDFELLLLNTSLGKLLLDAQLVMGPGGPDGLDEILDAPRAAHRARVLYALEKIPELVNTVRSPKLVYAHIVFPHPPFILNAQGEPLNNTPPDELAAYADQISYLNERLLDIVDAILDNSITPPVIIIQGDHGATLDYEGLGIEKSERLGIFSAYYLASLSNEGLPSTFSPVNNFRLIFDAFFSGHFGLLEDKSIIGRQSPFTRIPCSEN